MDDVRVLFVLPQGYADESETSDTMLQAFEACKKNITNVSWEQEANLPQTDLSKTDFVIFQDLKGRNFDAIKDSKCARILGPWCLLICLTEGKSIPNYPWPIYNVAMANSVVCCSHLPKTKKIQIKEKIQLMGGCCTDNLRSTNTHLITDSVMSTKYLQAAEAGLRLMIHQWVDEVWQASQQQNVHCDDEQFVKYRCLPFHNLTICSTGITEKAMKQEITELVVNNGGVFTGNMVVGKTDILVVYGEGGTLSAKYKAARSNPNTNCVSVEWIRDSAAKRYALAHNLYEVRKSTSTPNKMGADNPNFSIMSAIGEVGQRSTIDESVCSKSVRPLFTSPPKRFTPPKRKGLDDDDFGKLMDGLDIKKAKRAGQYLDGCSVFLAGFEPEQREKLCKIVNMSGATRYDDISDRLTHVIVGDPFCPEMKIIKTKNYAFSMVSFKWLLHSMEHKMAVDEEDYLINLHDAAREQFNSPLGRKGLSLLRTSRTLTSSDIEAASLSSQPEIHEPVENLMQHYLKTVETDSLAKLLENVDSNFFPKDTTIKSQQSNDITNTQSEGFSQNLNMFHKRKFMLVSFNMEESDCLKRDIENEGGTVVPKNYKAIPDFLVAPIFINATIQQSALEVVNNLWVQEAIQEKQDIPLEYFHRPLVIIDGLAPLQGAVVAISSYTSFERIFLQALIEALGAVCQDQFARVDRPEKGILSSTHLVSLEADGKKYNAAIKWGLPVVNKDWLLECARVGTMVTEDPFLVGEAKARRSAPSAVKNDATRMTDMVESREAGTSASQVASPFVPRFESPASVRPRLDISTSERTPVNKPKGSCEETPDACSQVTPVNKIMEEFRRSNLLGTPQTPPMPNNWFLIETPKSPFGAFIKPHLSPESKKDLMRYINQIPDYVPPPNPRRLSTPLSEVKRRCWAKLLGENSQNDSSEANVDNEEEAVAEVNKSGSTEMSTQTALLSTKLFQLEQMVNSTNENKRQSSKFKSTIRTQDRAKTESEPFTVGWDFNDDVEASSAKKNVIFVLSGIENELRQNIVVKVESLGAQVSDLLNYDPKCTHLLCPKPARNEKTLACMAAGKWILHVSYIDKCMEAGRLLDEELFEFGNPLGKDNIKMTFDKDNELRVQSMHWWRKEIGRRGYGAFNDMRAIVVAQKKDCITRVIEAGGGTIADIRPPFNNSVHLTHCFLEPKSVSNLSLYVPLAKQGVYCVNTLYISDFLYRTNHDIRDSILPHFTEFYISA